MKGKIVTFARYDEATQRKGIKLEVNGEEKWFSWFGTEEKSIALFGKIEKGELVEFEAEKTKIVSFKKAGQETSPTPTYPTTFIPANKYGKSEEEQTRMARMNALTNAVGTHEIAKEKVTPEVILKTAEQYVAWILKKEEVKKNE